MNNLKPCPFCGGNGKLTHFKSKNSNLEWFRVECVNSNCPASYMIGADSSTEEIAIFLWNRRGGKN